MSKILLTLYILPSGAEKPIIFQQKSRGMGGMGNMVGYSLTGLTTFGCSKKNQMKLNKD